MKIAVKTTRPVYQTINDGMCHVYREMHIFQVNLKEMLVVVNVADVAFKDENVIVPTLNGDGIFEDVNVVKRVYEKIIRQKNHQIQIDDINAMFSGIGKDIATAGDGFIDQLTSLMTQALLIDTQNANLFETEASDWELYNK